MFKPSPTLLPYSATKGSIVTFTEGLAQDVVQYGLRANCVAPGPVWTDASGAARACDACHGFPPVLTRQGTPHTSAPPALAACLGCHPFSPEAHVDGHVDLGAP